MDLDYKSLSFWWGVLQAMCTAAVFFYAHFKAAGRANAKAIEALRKGTREQFTEMRGKAHELDTRMHRLEERAANLPTHEDIGRIHTRVDNLGEGQKKLEGIMITVAAQVTLIHETLLHRGGK